MSKETVAEYIEEVSQKVFKGSISMRKYFEKSVSDVYKTQDGYLIEFSKPTIKKDFCFLYDEHVDGSVEDAVDSARVARQNKDYFFEQNLKDLERNLKTLEESEKIYLLPNYSGKTDIVRFYVNEEYIFKFPPKGFDQNEAEVSEAGRIGLIEMVKSEIEKFKKRLETYHKKYGTSKVRSWTYSCWD